MTDRSSAVGALAFLAGILFGVGLAVSQMVRPEVVLDFLQFEDFGLVLVMVGAAVVAGTTVLVASHSGRSAPLTNRRYGRRLKHLDRNVLLGGGIFGLGWGLSGICPGAAYASLGVGNYPILVAIVGMFVGAYLQGFARSHLSESPVPTAAD